MRRIVLGAMVLVACSPTWATIARVQSKANFAGSGSSCAATFTTNPTAHNLIVVWASWKPSAVTVSTVTDSLLNSYNNAVGPTTQPTSLVDSQIFYASNIAGGGSDTVTVNFSASTTICSVVIVEYTGPDQNSPLDITSTNTGASNSLNSGLPVPNFGNELVFAAASVDTGAASAGNGFGSIQATGGSLAEDNIQISNAQQHATATSSASGNWIMQMVTFRDSGYLWSGSQSIAGPRPYIDVTAYGAKGNGIADDTSAIQSAINASCATTISGSSVHPDVYFPPGIYGYSQPTSAPPTTPPTGLPSGQAITIPCSGITLTGSGGPSTTFSSGPGPWLEPINVGSGPNVAPTIQMLASGGALIAGVKIKNLTIIGYNQAVGIFNGTNITFEDANLYVNFTGQNDNTPVMANGVLWLFWNGGAVGFSTGTISQFKSLYDAEFVGNGGAGYANTDYLIFVTNVTAQGGGFLYDQRYSSGGNVPNDFVFRNVTVEASANGFFTVTSSGGTGLFTDIAGLTFDHAVVADGNASTPQGVFNLNAANVTASGVEINRSFGGSSPAIVVSNGSLEYYHIIACGNFCSFGAQDGSGNALAGGLSQTKSGFDDGVIQGSGYDPRLRSDMNAFGSAIQGTAFRSAFNNGRYAGVGLDPVFGLLVNTGADFGWGASVGQTVRGRMDIDFPATYPPTAVTGTAATGGTLTPATYYGTVFSTTTNCNNTESAPSIQSAGVVVGGSNNAVTWTWTLPMAGVSTIAGYCVTASPTPNLQSGQWQPVQANYTFVSGASTTSYTMTALPTCCGNDSTISPLTAAHSFTPNALGINNQSPAYDLDVTHTTATHSGIRATGANLTGLSTSSTVCTDASRNLTTSGCSGGSGITSAVWTDSTVAYAPNATTAKYLGVNGAGTTPVAHTSEGSMETPVPNNRTITITGITLVAGAPVGSGIMVTASIIDVTTSATLSCTTIANGTSCANTGTVSTSAEDMLVEEIQVASGTATTTNYSISVTYQ